MKTIHLAKAEPITKSYPVEPVTVVIDLSVDRSKDLSQWENFCNEQARLFCDVVLNALPQGVTDRIYVELTKRKASLMVFAEERWRKSLEEKQ